MVCTLCSCYPSGLLGIAPAWYKSREYRARAVREPRKILRDDFGTEIPPGKAIRVHDSTADHRYLVLPERPPPPRRLLASLQEEADDNEGMSEGVEETNIDWTEEELRMMVTRDSMLGVALVRGM